MLSRVRWVLSFFLAGLLLSGLTAFPLLTELKWLTKLRSIDTLSVQQVPNGMDRWLLVIRDGLTNIYTIYPWAGYGTDWLAFGHIAIALFFVAPIVDPVRNISVLYAGLVACFLVIPTALICGSIRGIPMFWRFIDCSFGVFGSLPLLYAIYLTRRLEANAR